MTAAIRTTHPMREQESRAKDIVLLNAVWRAWAEERPMPSILELGDLMDRSKTAARERVVRLTRLGWLVADDGACRSLRPGPRFAGLYDGMPMEIVG